MGSLGGAAQAFYERSIVIGLAWLGDDDHRLPPHAYQVLPDLIFTSAECIALFDSDPISAFSVNPLNRL
jgi:hypothetical protein